MSKVVLVTGSSKGLGSEIIKKYAKNGYNVVINYNKDKISAEELKDFVEKNYKVEALVVKADVSVEEEVINMISTIIKKFNQIDVVVNNAAIELSTEIKEKNASSFRKVLDTNLIGTFLVSKYASVEMLKRESGSIINISSIGSVVPDLSRTAYCVAKAAINSLTQNIALQYAQHKVRCNAILPGLTATKAALNNMPDEFRNSFLKHIPLGRMGQPEDIGNAVLLYASDESSYITGDILEIAGGYALGTPQYSEFTSK